MTLSLDDVVVLVRSRLTHEERFEHKNMRLWWIALGAAAWDDDEGHANIGEFLEMIQETALEALFPDWRPEGDLVA